MWTFSPPSLSVNRCFRSDFIASTTTTFEKKKKIMPFAAAITPTVAVICVITRSVFSATVTMSFEDGKFVRTYLRYFTCHCVCLRYVGRKFKFLRKNVLSDFDTKFLKESTYSYVWTQKSWFSKSNPTKKKKSSRFLIE